MEYKVKQSLLTLIQKKPMKLRNRHLTTGEKEQHMFSAWPPKNSNQGGFKKATRELLLRVTVYEAPFECFVTNHEHRKHTIQKQKNHTKKLDTFKSNI